MRPGSFSVSSPDPRLHVIIIVPLWTWKRNTREAEPQSSGLPGRLRRRTVADRRLWAGRQHPVFQRQHCRRRQGRQGAEPARSGCLQRCGPRQEGQRAGLRQLRPYRSRDASFSIEAPTEWSGVQRKSGSKEIIAAPNVDQFLKNYQTGILVLRFDSKTAEEILTFERKASYPDCKAGEIRPYDDGRLKGFSQTFTDCGGSGAGAIVAVTSSQDDETFRGFFDTSFVDTRDVAALKRIISSLQYTKL